MDSADRLLSKSIKHSEPLNKIERPNNEYNDSELLVMVRSELVSNSIQIIDDSLELELNNFEMMVGIKHVFV